MIRLVGVVLSLGVVAGSLVPEELEALRDIFQAAKLPWRRDPCTVEQLKCLDDHVTSLNFYSQNLTWLPGSLGQLRALRELRLQKNEIASLPESIGQLEALQILDVGTNRLVSLPSSIGQLESLKKMYASKNQLTALPASIAGLKALTGMDLRRNQLTLLPDLGSMTSLASLQVSSNQLVALPETIGNLPALTNLDLEGNHLSALPISIGQMRSLISLQVGENRLTSLPQSLEHMYKLKHLDLRYNQLRTLPESLGDLESLEFLTVSHNQLETLPESLGRLPKLSFVHVSFNRLELLPWSLGSMKLLQNLHAAGNALTSLPKFIGGAWSLSTLHLGSNKLTSLHESIGQLENLRALYLQDNQLTLLPESMGKLKNLRFLSLASNHLRLLPGSFANLNLEWLLLDSNRLTSLPPLQAQMLRELRAAKNELNTLPESLSYMPNLQVLSVHNNLLDDLNSLGNGSLVNLQVALLHSNGFSEPGQICRFATHGLRTLYLHGNKLKGTIPSCLDQFTSLEVLTLHRNKLAGPVPGTLAKLPKLSVLTLHKNRLSGNLPEELTTAPSLTFFSAHSNRLVGPIPPLNLLKDCMNDASFLHAQRSCDSFDLHGLGGDACNHPDVVFHCPKSCLACSNASARGPLLFLHDNHLSCSLPEQVTRWPSDMRSISVVGNMLGNGTQELPPWVHQHEHQPFLYFSRQKGPEMIIRALLLAFVCGLFWLLMFGTTGHRSILSSKSGSPVTNRLHWFLLRMSAALSALAAALFILYFAAAEYYVCGDMFASFTVSTFSTPYHGTAVIEWSVAILWTIWVALGAVFLRGAPAPKVHRAETNQTNWAHLHKFICSVFWLLIVAVLSFPSVAYAVVSAIPLNNTLRLSGWWLMFFRYQAALVMILVDMFITPKVVRAFSGATGMRSSMLSMAARLGTMWLAAVLSTLYLTTHCMNGWTHLWEVCDETTEDYKLFNISLGDIPILEPKSDLCSAKGAWWSDSACPRALVDTMAPLLVSKMITRAFLQPIITLLRWQASYPKDGQLYTLCGMIRTSSSLEDGRQASLLVTMAEVALLWGALVPVLLPAVLLATGTNMLMSKVGHGHFAVAPVTRDKAEAGMSRRYLHGSLSVLVFFQNWFAWTSGMHGRWLLLFTALLYVGELMGLVPGQERQRIAVLEEVRSISQTDG